MKTLLFFLSLLWLPTMAQKSDSLLKANDKNATDVARLIIAIDQANRQTSNDYQNSIMSFDSRYEGLKGTYYLIPKWLEGDLYGNEGKLVASRVPIKYDAFNKEVIRKRNERDTIAVYPSAFTIYEDERIYKFVKKQNFVTTTGKKIGSTYLQILFEHRVGFFKNITKSLLKADYKGPYSDNRAYDSFEDTVQYFLVKENGEIEQIKLGKKSIIQALEPYKVPLENYINTHGLDLKKELDVIKLIAFYSELLPEIKK
jgi:hypothetical protein